MKLTTTFLLICAIIYGCSQSGEKQSNTSSTNSTAQNTSDYDPKRGEGKWEQVELETNLNKAMANEGKLISDLKCASCHKYTDERLVGPGWLGVSERHRPEWIMNFITNPDPMIDKDPVLQAQLELCLVRMPNQNLSDEEARNILEFMRQIDGVE
jgi:hypothetical protein